MQKSPTTITCEDIEGKTFEVSSDELTFRPAVYGVIIQEDKILLSKQWNGYNFPGGGIELGENTEDALKREVKEETGIEISVGKILHCQNSFFKLPFKGNFVHSIHVFYECKVIGGELSTKYLDENEKKYAEMAEWVPLTKIPDLKIFSSVDAKKVLEAVK
ncbi:MAG: NUDIX hydrolase [Candidatus Pacebacteria bacterium CG10_big_fil_rev_8_21_14_0_10_42_12]|nr:MAG: NUDIX hydrolase [Candidatus Pacebacteria bacterium CG10_big_fil_rev_8_21_14_0_10_42_12]